MTAQFRSGVDLVEVYATVTDAHGEAVSGLTASDFTLEENGRPQTIRVFTAGTVPLSLAVAIDRSFSLPQKRLRDAVSALDRFIGQLQSEDRMALIGIGSDVELLAPLDVDRGPARAALAGLERWGTTPLYDAVASAVAIIEQERGRRALILLSDGEDRYSRLSAADIVSRVREQDVLIYPVSIGAHRPPEFAELATVTGGRSFHAPTARDLAAALSTIARELSSQYLLGYSPVPTEDPSAWRSIRVTVKRPDLRVRARDGYRVHP